MVEVAPLSTIMELMSLKVNMWVGKKEKQAELAEANLRGDQANQKEGKE